MTAATTRISELDRAMDEVTKLRAAVAAQAAKVTELHNEKQVLLNDLNKLTTAQAAMIPEYASAASTPRSRSKTSDKLKAILEEAIVLRGNLGV